MLSGQPIIILKEGTERTRGKDAQGNNIQAAIAIADAVRSTLGPKGMDKMLVDSLGDVIITNDGVTILKEIDIEHPAAKMMVEIAKTQDQECGDGTTTAVILAGALLKNAQDLLAQNVHPTIIADGYRMANEKACEIIEKLSEKVTLEDADILKKIAETSMTGKTAAFNRVQLADIAFQAVRAIVEKTMGKSSVDLDNIKIEKKQGGSMKDTELINGIILDKERVHPAMPKTVKDAKILLLNQALEIKKTEVDAKIQIRDPTQLQKFLDEEENVLKNYVQKITESGAQAVICQKGIDDLAQHYLAQKKIFAIRRVSESDMKKISKATGASIVSQIQDIKNTDLGFAGFVITKKIGEDEMIFITHCKNPKAVSILIRGGTEHVVDELERSLHDALSVIGKAIENGKITSGGGSLAIEIAMGLQDYAGTIGGREQMAIEAYANAVESIPRALANNSGFDAIDILLKLRQAHKKGKKTFGINVYTGDIADMKKQNVIEPAVLNTQAIQTATEGAVMILRIDDVIAAKGGSQMPSGSPGGGPGGDEDFEGY